MRLTLPVWWYIAPTYLTLWTLAFSLWNIVDGNGMMAAFGVDTGGASPFIMLNSGARYIAIGVAMVMGIWVFRTYHAVLTALFARLVMDVLDLAAGLMTGLVMDALGVLQSFGMFLLPNLFTLVTLYILHKRTGLQ